MKTVVDTYYTSNISADAKSAVNGGWMFLLTTSAANAITNADVRKCSQASGGAGNGWWLSSQGSGDSNAASVSGILSHHPWWD